MWYKDKVEKMKSVKGLIKIVIVLAFSFCVKAKKDINDYFPKVTNVSATVNSNGDVIVEGEIDLDSYEILSAGFCVDTLPEPSMLRNQREFSLPNQKKIEITYNNVDPKLTFKKFDKKKTYYFRAWACNRYGYAYSNTIPLTDIKGVAIAPPCTMPVNTIDIGLGSGNQTLTIDGPPYANNDWLFQINFDTSNMISFRFGSKPVTKRFITTNSYNLGGADRTRITLNGPNMGASNGNYLLSGTIVYVEEVSDTTFMLSICNAPWNPPPQFNTLKYLNMKLLVKY